NYQSNAESFRGYIKMKLNMKKEKEKNFPPKADQPQAEKGMKKNELVKKLVSLREEERVLRFKAEGAKSKNVKEAMTLRKQIARILTEINSK
ncbi:MAG: 50S ribosomal protein L29, partial [bacterium]|nr:50S ribosomal protein L29 [bacterium]